MPKYASDVAFTPAVKSIQDAKGSRNGYARMEENSGWETGITDQLIAFIGGQDSFYFGTASADGQPYIQHRGGPRGFLEILDEKTLAFADFQGNRQYITSGNLSENNKAYIFLMDYPNRRRVKVWGQARVSDDPDLISRLSASHYRGKPEQAIVFQITAWDVNCPQHITPRFSTEEVEEMVAPLTHRIAELEAQLNDAKDNT
jgi:predicted pyridoxine 5'-phosphate oxidase superfamily flavin-nucleotide-binding protein